VRQLAAILHDQVCKDVPQVREGNWKVAPLPADLMDRRVEITGPTDRKMVRAQARRQLTTSPLCCEVVAGGPVVPCRQLSAR